MPIFTEILNLWTNMYFLWLILKAKAIVFTWKVTNTYIYYSPTLDDSNGYVLC